MSSEYLSTRYDRAHCHMAATAAAVSHQTAADGSIARGTRAHDREDRLRAYD
jgi:hypothetical protein